LKALEEYVEYPSNLEFLLRFLELMKPFEL